MYKKCEYCGTVNDAPDKYCKGCGAPLPQLQPVQNNRPVSNNRPIPNVVVTNGVHNTLPVNGNKNKKKNKVKASKKADRKVKAPNQKKGVKRILKPILVIVIVAAVVAFAWFAVGNQITLSIHTDKDVKTMNSGSLEMPGANYNQYGDMPDYVVEMLGGNPDSPDYGPLMTEVLKYVYVERNSVNGFFGKSTAEFTIYAPDLESWLVNLDGSKKYTQDTLLEEMKAYLPNAPKRSQQVTIEYAHDGIFGWQGNYMSLEFANAVSGGINTAYNELYTEFSKDLEANIQ